MVDEYGLEQLKFDLDMLKSAGIELAWHRVGTAGRGTVYARGSNGLVHVEVETEIQGHHVWFKSTLSLSAGSTRFIQIAHDRSLSLYDSVHSVLLNGRNTLRCWTCDMNTVEGIEQ